MEAKECSKCGEVKDLCEFGKRKDSKDGHRRECKKCAKKMRKLHYEANKDKVAEQRRSYYEANKERFAEKNKTYYQNNKQERLSYLKDYREKNKELLAEKQKVYYQKNKDKVRAYCKANREKINERQRIYQAKRRANDPSFRMTKSVGNAIRKAIKKQGTTKGGKTFSALSYAPQDLVEHLEKQFDEKMTWDNYGTYWDIDHIYPQSLLPYSSLEDENFHKCWALSNLRPLEKRENQRKSNKILDG